MKLQLRKQAKILCYVALSLFVSLSASLSHAEAKTLVPVGKTVGVTAILKGIRVINTAEFETVDGKSISPAEKAGIRSGDTILKINGKDINSAAELSAMTNKIGGEKMRITFLHNGAETNAELQAEKNSDDGKFCIGVWIKDSSSGIGTMTFYDPESKFFGALGHGMCTDDKLTEISGGSILDAEIASIRQGEKGAPGELIGIFTESSTKLGEIISNTDVGIFGKLEDNGNEACQGDAIEVASRDEVNEGSATILSNINDSQVEEFDVEIQKINKDKNDSKGMIIKIIDPDLLEKTGGIVQGMSGSPILQNGKIVGAVTHVFVNDPTRGYGIFIENMLAEAEKMK